MKKKIILFVFMLVLGTVAIFALAFPTYANEKDGYRYSVNNGEVTILYKFEDISGELVIPDKIDGYSVTVISQGAFRNAKNLTKITLPSTLVEIESYAFEGCSALESIVIPNSVTKMGDYVFMNCKSLKECKLSNALDKIPMHTFSGCTSLQSFEITSNIKTIGYCAFKDCTSLTEIYVPETVTKVDGAFYDCNSLKKITLPFVGDSATQPYNKTFGAVFGSSNELDVPQSLKEVVILGGEIPEEAFFRCKNIEKIHLGKKVSKIGSRAFWECHALNEITVENGNSVYHSSGNCLIETATKRMIVGCKESVIPNDGSVTTIASFAFCGSTEIKKMTVPNAVTKIEISAFEGCTGIEEMTLPFLGETSAKNSKSHFAYIFGDKSAGYLSYKTTTVLKSITVTGDCSIVESSLSSFHKLVSFRATGRINSVDIFAFSGCEKLKTVRFEKYLGSIEDEAFAGCDALVELLLPSNIKELSPYFFYGYKNIKLLCEKGSYIEKYAKENKIPYEIVDLSELETETQATAKPTETQKKPQSTKKPNQTAQTTTESANLSGESTQSDTNVTAKNDGCDSAINSLQAFTVILCLIMAVAIFRVKKHTAK